MSASEANAKAAQAALELQEAQVVRSQAERAKTLKSEKDMKEEMEAQQLGYKLWTIDTSIDPPKKKPSLISKDIYSTPKPEDGSVHRNLLKNQGAKDRDLNLPLFLVFASDCLRFAVLKTELSSRQESGRYDAPCHCNEVCFWFISSSTEMVFHAPSPVAGVDEHVGGAKTGNGIHRSQLVSGRFWSFQKLGIRSC